MLVACKKEHMKIEVHLAKTQPVFGSLSLDKNKLKALIPQVQLDIPVDHLRFNIINGIYHTSSHAEAEELLIDDFSDEEKVKAALDKINAHPHFYMGQFSSTSPLSITLYPDNIIFTSLQEFSYNRGGTLTRDWKNEFKTYLNNKAAEVLIEEIAHATQNHKSWKYPFTPTNWQRTFSTAALAIAALLWLVFMNLYIALFTEVLLLASIYVLDYFYKKGGKVSHWIYRLDSTERAVAKKVTNKEILKEAKSMATITLVENPSTIIAHSNIIASHALGQQHNCDHHH